MTKQEILEQIQGGLIVSCQALEHEPLYTKRGRNHAADGESSSSVGRCGNPG